MTDEELRQPGVAWEEAKKSLAKGDFAEAERLRAFMVKSDSMLMFAKIVELRANAKGDAIKPCPPTP